MGLSIHPRLTFPTDLKWSYTGTTSSKSLTGESCRWRGPTSWRLGCGLSLSRRKDWTTAVWRESGSSSCLKRCSTLTTAYLNTLPRKSLLTVLVHLLESYRPFYPALTCSDWDLYSQLYKKGIREGHNTIKRLLLICKSRFLGLFTSTIHYYYFIIKDSSVLAK